MHSDGLTLISATTMFKKFNVDMAALNFISAEKFK